MEETGYYSLSSHLKKVLQLTPLSCCARVCHYHQNRGAKIAGPAISISFLACGMACILTSLAYAEFASRIPAAGSAFTYVYVAFGEFYAWIVGWNLILGYGFTASVAARAWGDYTGDFIMKAFSQRIVWIERLTELAIFGESVQYTCSPLSMLIVALSTVVLLRGAKDSSRFNNIMTVTNISILFLVIVAGLSTRSVNVENMEPFAPKGLPGIMQGSGLVFFAFIGFDMVASLSEEVVHPEKNMPIGIVGSLIISTLIYVSVSLAVVGMAPFEFLGEKIPIVNALLVNACCTHGEQLVQAGHPEECLLECPGYERPVLGVIGHIVSGGAIFGLMASCFTSLMGQPRIFYRMAQDGLWFRLFAELDPVTGVPKEGIIITGIVTALLACFVPLEALANLISLGTLMVFTFVDAGVILLRLRNVSEASEAEKHPNLTREERRKVFAHSNKTIALLLLLFTGSMLGASIFLANSTSKTPVLLLLLLAALSGSMIQYFPDSWTVASNPGDHEHSQFSCPWVPILPLGGVACNSFMMGSLPPSSWLLCLVWLAFGIAVYFAYGIHHSTLGKSRRYAETAPLLAVLDGTHVHS
jgi:APA family basic amino acid/polyamine antiporter